MINYSFGFNLRERLASWGNLLIANKDTSSKAIDSAEGSSDGQKISRREANSRILKSLFFGGLGASALAKRTSAQEIIPIPLELEEELLEDLSEVEDDPFAKYMDEGISLKYQGLYKEAIKKFDLAIKELGEIEGCSEIYRLGTVCDESANASLEDGNYPQAIKRYSLAIENYEREAKFFKKDLNKMYRQRGRLNYNKFNLLTALKDFGKALELNPDDKMSEDFYSHTLKLVVLAYGAIPVLVSSIPVLLLWAKINSASSFEKKQKQLLVYLNNFIKNEMSIIWMDHEEDHKIILEFSKKLDEELGKKGEHQNLDELLEESKNVAKLIDKSLNSRLLKRLIEFSSSLDFEKSEFATTLLESLNKEILGRVVYGRKIDRLTKETVRIKYEEFLKLCLLTFQKLEKNEMKDRELLIKFLKNYTPTLFNNIHKIFRAMGFDEKLIENTQKSYKSLLEIRASELLGTDSYAVAKENILSIGNFLAEQSSSGNPVEIMLAQAKAAADKFSELDIVKMSYYAAVSIEKLPDIRGSDLVDKQKCYEEAIKNYENLLNTYTENQQLEQARALKEEFGAQIDEFRAKLKALQ